MRTASTGHIGPEPFTAGARAKGMTDEMFAELMAVTALANETNRLANGFRVPVDDAFRGFPD